MEAQGQQINYEDLCRLCASFDAIKMDIFSESGKQRKLVDKITTCLPFQVSEDDLLPKSLCYRCIYNLENFYDFRNTCINALERLEVQLKANLKNLAKVKKSVSTSTDEKDDVLPALNEAPKPPTPKPPISVSPTVTCSPVVVAKTEPENKESKLQVGIQATNGEIADSDGDDPPNPADFLEACMREPAQNGFKTEEEEGPFPCRTCGRLFNSRSSLTIHAKFHQDKRNSIRLPNQGSYENTRESFACYVCEKVFSSKGHLALHSKVHIGEPQPSPNNLGNRPAPAFIKLYHCDLCNKSYSMAKHLWGHVSTAHKGDPLVTCNICLRTFSSISNLEDHKRVKHKDENIDQQLSNLTPTVQLEEGLEEDLSVENKPDLDEAPSNRRKNTKPRKIERESSEPNDTLQDPPESSPADPEEPEKSPPEVNPDVEAKPAEPPPAVDIVGICPVCEQKFEDRNDLNQHLIDIHGYVQQQDVPQDYYGSGESAYVESMMEPETVFYCEVCIREFNDRASLWLHMLYSHREEASKACGICLKVCSDNEELTQHVEECHPRDKTDQRRYSCQICARQHDSRKKLITHAKIHKLVDDLGNPIEPESVVVLNSHFYPPEGANNTSLNLEGNALLPSCEICYKIFETDAKLSKHRRSVHRDLSTGSIPIVYFACELCGLTNNSRTERWKHMATAHAGDPSITCDLPHCGKVFSMSILKQEHVSNHHTEQGQYPNTCEVCGKMWKTRVEYWKHMMGVHSDCLPFVCGVCLKVFTSLQPLVKHVREMHWPLEGGDYCCDICGRPYSKASKMSRHRKIHYTPDATPEIQALLEHSKVTNEPQHFLQQPSSYKCDQCEGGNIEFENLEDLGKHRKDEHNVMPCDLCTKYYGRTSHLWKHVNKIHKGHPDITCHLCQRTSASRSHLASHMAKNHRNEETNSSCRVPADLIKVDSVSCEKCSKVFRKESLARKHMKHCKGPRPPPMPLPPTVDGMYACTRCDRKFPVPNLLKRHLKNSHVSYKCEICRESLNNKTLWFNHVVDQHGDHPDVKCTYADCGKVLRCKADLERHRRDHRHNIQLHMCVFCAELVTSKFKMKKHLKAMHASETKYLCAACLKPHKNFSELRAHIEDKHSSLLDRTFTCQVCCKTCVSKSKLIEHLKCHGPNFLPCKICLKTFASKEDLENHVNNHPSDSGDDEDEIAPVDNLDTNSIMDIIGAPPGKSIEKKRIREEVERAEMPTSKKLKKEYSCILCPKMYSKLLDLTNHERDIHNDLRCDSCGGMSLSESDYLTHKTTCDGTNLKHPVTSAVSAGVDGNDLDSTQESDSSFMHLLGLMPGSDKLLKRGVIKGPRTVYEDDFTASKCEICLKVWPAKRHLWQHLIRFHKFEAGTSCGVCLKYCIDYPSLSLHLINDHPSNFDGESSNLTCKVCGKYHNARSKLQNHVVIHPREEDRALATQHACLICRERFLTFRTLIDHTNSEHLEACSAKKKLSAATVVNGETKLPFHTCDICSLVFASEIGLTNHRRIHENSDNFKCGQCGQLFGSAENLSKHKAEKHRGAEFVCADCKSNFASYTQLTEHNKVCRAKGKVLELSASMEVDDNDDVDDEEDVFEEDYMEEEDPDGEDADEEDVEEDEEEVDDDDETCDTTTGEASEKSEEGLEEEEDDDVDDEDSVINSELSDEDEDVEDSDDEESVNKEPEVMKKLAYVCDDMVEVVRVDLDEPRDIKSPNI